MGTSFGRSLCHQSSHSGNGDGVPELQSVPKFAVLATQPPFQIPSPAIGGTSCRTCGTPSVIQTPWSCFGVPEPTCRLGVATRRLTDPLARPPRTLLATASVWRPHPATPSRRSTCARGHRQSLSLCGCKDLPSATVPRLNVDHE